jgi:hypothetical protein
VRDLGGHRSRSQGLQDPMAHARRLAGGQASARSADSFPACVARRSCCWLRGCVVRLLAYRCPKQVRTRSRRSEPSSGRAPVFEAQARPPRIVACFGGSGSVDRDVVVAPDERSWTLRSSQRGWPDAQAARPSSPSADTATGATSTAAPLVPPKRVLRACAVPAAAIG